MDNSIYFFILVLFVMAGYFHYRIIQLERKIKENNSKRAKELSDAGKAITETLRSAFDNIKVLNQKHERLNKNVKELETRFQSLTSHDKRLIKQRIQNISKDGKSSKYNEELE
jgi:Fic family protein